MPGAPHHIATTARQSRRDVSSENPGIHAGGSINHTTQVSERRLASRICATIPSLRDYSSSATSPPRHECRGSLIITLLRSSSYRVWEAADIRGIGLLKFFHYLCRASPGNGSKQSALNTNSPKSLLHKLIFNIFYRLSHKISMPNI